MANIIFMDIALPPFEVGTGAFEIDTALSFFNIIEAENNVHGWPWETKDDMLQIIKPFEEGLPVVEVRYLCTLMSGIC